MGESVDRGLGAKSTSSHFPHTSSSCTVWRMHVYSPVRMGRAQNNSNNNRVDSQRICACPLALACILPTRMAHTFQVPTRSHLDCSIGGDPGLLGGHGKEGAKKGILGQHLAPVLSGVEGEGSERALVLRAPRKASWGNTWPRS